MSDRDNYLATFTGLLHEIWRTLPASAASARGAIQRARIILAGRVNDAALDDASQSLRLAARSLPGSLYIKTEAGPVWTAEDVARGLEELRRALPKLRVVGSVGEKLAEADRISSLTESRLAKGTTR